MWLRSHYHSTYVYSQVELQETYMTDIAPAVVAGNIHTFEKSYLQRLKYRDRKQTYA